MIDEIAASITAIIQIVGHTSLIRWNMIRCDAIYYMLWDDIFLCAIIQEINLAPRLQVSTYAIVSKGWIGLSEGDIYCRPGRNVHGMLLSALHLVRLVGRKKWKILSFDWLCYHVDLYVRCLAVLDRDTIIYQSRFSQKGETWTYNTKS